MASCCMLPQQRCSAPSIPPPTPHCHPCCSILAALQDRVPPRPFADIDAALRLELGAPAAELFAEFDSSATAAASLAQVHKGVLQDGSVVAVKVQYPKLEAQVGADLATMLALSDASHRLFPATNWRWLFQELQRRVSAVGCRTGVCMAGGHLLLAEMPPFCPLLSCPLTLSLLPAPTTPSRVLAAGS